MSTPRRSVCAGLIFVAACIAACGSGTDHTSTALSLADTSVGTVIVDADGFTVYLFVPDQRGSSTCDGECAERWPPVAGSDVQPSVADGLDVNRLSTIQRNDGTVQLTYNGWPLYRFVGDTDEGAVAGHGQGNVWFAMAPTGEAAGTTK